ncbi:hypothetical protein K449DRAFT_459864 [Hypoxylon sp. EC38]|nr:hypothetical protein K449DRAFT_459864 [Hypoxylon sp. EC38]
MGVITSLFSTFSPGAALYATYAALGFIWPHARPLVAGDDALATRYMHATKGKPAWALVTDAESPIGRAQCSELAARGFNVVLYSSCCTTSRTTQQQKELGAIRNELLKAYPENKYRIVIGGASSHIDRKSDAAAEFVNRVAGSLEDVNLTMVVNNVRSSAEMNCDAENVDTTLPPELMAALMPLLRRNAPALLVNVAVSPLDAGIVEVPLCSFCDSSNSFSRGGADAEVDVVSCYLGDVTSSGQDAVSFIRPTPPDLARAVLLHAGYSRSRGRNAVVYPYLPDALIQTMRERLPTWVMDQVLVLVGGDIKGWDRRAIDYGLRDIIPAEQ